MTRAKVMSAIAIVVAIVAAGFLGAAIHARCVATRPATASDSDDVIVLKPPPPSPPPAIDAMAEAAIDAEDIATDANDCAHTCNDGDGCPSVSCRCEDGDVIGTQDCQNGCCLAAPEACIRSCVKHDGVKGSWSNDREGGKSTGKSCGGNRDCASGLCFRGYCTRKCDSFGDCPPFWKCEAPPNMGLLDRFCQQN